MNQRTNAHANVIGRGLDPMLMMVGLGLAALGLGAAAIGLFTSYGLRVGPIPIPLSIVGPIVVLAGLYVVFSSFRADKCLACNAALDTSLAAFPPDAEAFVYEAAHRLDVAALARVPMGRIDAHNVQVTFHSCPKCRACGKVEVISFGQSRRILEPGLVVTGPSVGTMAEFLSARASAHEARYEGA